jgi:hypothetical protein
MEAGSWCSEYSFHLLTKEKRKYRNREGGEEKIGGERKGLEERRKKLKQFSVEELIQEFLWVERDI